MPMRFADLDGTLVDVYQAVSQMTDESGQQYPLTVDTLLDSALGAQGHYGAFGLSAHTDLAQNSISDAVLASALTRGVPLVSSRQMLEWLDGRNSSSFGSLAWNGNALSFTVAAGSGANGLEALVPMASASGLLTSISRDGGSITFSGEVIKGVQYARIAASAGSYTATYTADATPPTVISVSPTDGATAVSQGTAVTATFSEAMAAGTVTASTFELRGPGNTLVPASVVYDAPNRTATLAPAALLAPSTAYTATVQGGAGPSVKDLSGNAMTGDFTWSFTTVAGPTCPCTGWSPSTVPGTTANPDPNSVELGVKFRPAVNGFVNSIRFYKGSTNTGTHTGTLWTATGQQLATATFTNETGTGWQEVSFATPVSVLANTVYVASYHAPNGNYAVDRFYFATSGFDSGPLHFLKDGESGGNGVFVYSAATAFPTNSFEATNYWVDVVFATTFSDTTPPSVVARSPASGATDVNTGSSVTATFDEAIDTATINGSTFELRDSGNALVSAAVTYTGATKTATLNPTSALGNLAAYTATLRGGATDPRIKDVSGNPLAANVSWSFTTAPVVASCVSAPNAIVAENCQPGNPSSEWEITGIGDLGVQGFATDISVNRGQTVFFKVSTPASDYRLDIYRMGYYGGLGARKVATAQPSIALPQSQPACLSDASTGLVDCGNWAVSASWGVPATATSGIYFAKAVRADTGGASHIFFVVRDDSGTSDLLFQTSDTTWQAYNSYGGNSLYVGAPAGRAYKVSYNRPVNTRVSFNGNSWVFNAEYPMVRWLERNGYDVSYSTGVDSDRRGNLIGNHKVFLSVGHDEYWSSAQRTNVEAARNTGVHLAFFSGNEVFWKTRWETSIDGSAIPYRTLVCYKETHANAKIDPLPNVWTGTWRDPRCSPPGDGGRPENALTGTIFTVNDGATTSIEVPEADGKMRLWRNTSIATLAPGAIATLPFGTLGYEWDEDLDNGFRPGGVIRMTSTTVGGVPLLQDFGSTYASGTATHHLTLYRHSSNRLVFGAGTVQWSWGLDDNHDHPTGPPDARMQQATVNLLADMGVSTTTLQPGLVPASASTDAAPPSSTITFPTGGSSVPRFSQVTISGTAADTGGGVVGGVEVSVDNGATWHPANGRASWSYIWSPQTSGPVTIRSRAIDDSGNIETPGAGVNVTVTAAAVPTLVAAYSFGEGAGSSVADASGNAHAGTISGATWTAAGRFGSALSFDGTNDWVTVADAADLDLGTGMTLEAWVNPSALSGWRTAIMKESAGGLAYSLYANDDAPRPAVYVNTGAADQAAIGTGSLPLNAWTHLAATYNGTTLRLYVNGAEVGSQPVSGTIIATSAVLRMGGNSVWGEYFAGLLDEVRVYSGPLTASEIQTDMVTPVGSPPADTTPPTVTSTTPVNGATGVSPASPVTVVFSEAMNAATISGSTFELRDPGNALVPATVGYNASTNTATLTPTSPLASSASYT
ncbi:MAG: N,N-dimethylformamidase beta subunit family domain-containing protein, partial [bacterium]